MQAWRSFCWALFGVGLTLCLTHDNWMMRRLGTTIVLTAMLALLWIYLREHQPSWERINAVGEPKLSILETLPDEAGLPPQTVPVNTPMQSTPVQRLLDEDR